MSKTYTDNIVLRLILKPQEHIVDALARAGRLADAMQELFETDPVAEHPTVTIEVEHRGSRYEIECYENAEDEIQELLDALSPAERTGFDPKLAPEYVREHRDRLASRKLREHLDTLLLVRGLRHINKTLPETVAGDSLAMACGSLQRVLDYEAADPKGRKEICELDLTNLDSDYVISMAKIAFED